MVFLVDISNKLARGKTSETQAEGRCLKGCSSKYGNIWSRRCHTVTDKLQNGDFGMARYLAAIYTLSFEIFSLKLSSVYKINILQLWAKAWQHLPKGRRDHPIVKALERMPRLKIWQWWQVKEAKLKPMRENWRQKLTRTKNGDLGLLSFRKHSKACLDGHRSGQMLEPNWSP